MPQTIVEEHSLESNSLSQSVSLEGSTLRGPEMPQFLAPSFVKLFEQQAAQNPRKVAVIAGKTYLTYAELNERANQLANHLRGSGSGRESIVGICIDRSLEMAIGIVGILKSGAAYLPLDPEYPKERLAFMIGDAQPTVIVTKSKLAGLIPAEPPVVLFDDDLKLTSLPANDLCEKPRPADLAYVIYTSGSTGQPKGVMIEHGNLSNYLLALNHEIGIRSDDVYLHLASIAFSSSRRQLLLPLSQGASVLIADSAERKDPLKLFETIRQRGVTVMDAVPSFWRSCTTILKEFEEAERHELLRNNLRMMLSASEPLPADIPRTWMKEFRHPARHVHMFGQTETAGIVCVNEVSDNGEAAYVPIGHPIANTEIAVLDEEMKPCAPGEVGELFIGGAGVGRGYLNHAELTSKKFITRENARFYRTGDFARVRAGGTLEFAGRRDQQIKVRGFRVELGEVETAIAAHPAIRECAVIAKSDGRHNARLVAFFVSKVNTPSGADLRAFLESRLPEHAIPTAFVELDALPISANGKLNRLDLSEREDCRVIESSTYAAPGTEAERQLVAIFLDVLRLDQIGIDDNFFGLGGDSLLAGQVIARVRRRFKIDAPISWLFESPTVRELASRLEIAVKDESIDTPLKRVSRDEPLPLSSAQHRLWFLDQLDPGNYVYNLTNAMEINGALDVNALRQSFNAIITRHEILRTRFVEIEGVPFQKIDLPAETDWQLIDLSHLPPEQREREVPHLLEAESRRPFSLATGPLLRVRLLRLEHEKFLLLMTMHHIVSDGWSAGVLANDLAAFYQAFKTGTSPSLAELPVQYADFAAWQRESFAPGRLSSQVAYWRNQLASAPPTLNLPTDRVRTEDSHRGATETVRVSADLANQLKDFSRAQGATLFMILLSAFDVMLARYGGDRDIVVGTPVAGRTRVDIEPLIGMFVATLPLRVKLSEDETVLDLLSSVHETSLAAYANQDVPFETLVSELQYERTLQHNPIFQVMFALQSGIKPLPRLTGLNVNPLELKADTAKFDLSLIVADTDEALDISVSYKTDLFERDSARCMLADFQIVLEAFTANPQQRLSDLPALSWIPKELPIQTQATASTAPTPYIAPRTPIEERLASIWTEVLSLDRVGIEDNFFMLGGHSLMATQLIARIRNAFAYELPLRRLFQTPTISGLATAIREAQASNTEDEEFAALLAEIDGLSDDEALREFAQEHAV